MLNFIAKPMGLLVKLLYDVVSGLDSSALSAYAISIILSTIIFKLLMMPLTLNQTKSMKKMQDLNPQIQELQKKYANDPQTLQRKQMELYKEANYSPFSGCLPLLIQFPIMMAFFYVLREPVKYIFHDQTLFDSLNKSFLWIKDLGFAENQLVEGVINGIGFGGTSLPLIGAALPVLAILSALTTYLTSKMTSTSQANVNEQQKTTQNTMTIMMPFMIFFIALNFPSGLGLYWVISNVIQLIQQYIVLNSSKKPKEEL